MSPQEIAGIYRERAWVGQERTNSGAAVLGLAAYWFARRIVLLGYDLQHTGGKAHWHGDHPPRLGNAGGWRDWPDQFRALMPRLQGIEVINASRETALTLFPRATIEEALT